MVNDESTFTTMSNVPTEKSLNPELSTNVALHSHIRQLLLECPSRKVFFERILNICLQQLPATMGYLEFAVGKKRQAHLIHGEHMEPIAVDQLLKSFLKPSISDVWSRSAEQRPIIRQLQRGDQNVTVVSAAIPNVSAGSNDAVISILLNRTVDPKDIVPRIEGVTALAAAVMVSKTHAVPPSEPANQHGSDQQSQLLSARKLAAESSSTNTALARATHFSSEKEFAFSVVNSLCAERQAEQVSFGTVRQQKVAIEAISNVPVFKANSPGVVQIRQAMEECYDHGQPVVAQQQQSDSDVLTLPIHRQWSSDTQGASILSIPLMENDTVNAVISIQRSASRPFSPEEIVELKKVLQPYGPVLPVIRKANQSIGQRLKQSADNSVRQAMAPRSFGRWLALGCIVALVCWFAFGTLLYRPVCRTTVRASELRSFAAPFAGKLEQVYVSPGQRVKTGHVLARFETRDLELSLNTLIQEIGSAKVQMRQALEDDDLPKAALSRERINVLQAEAVTVRQQIESASLVAMTDGVVMVSDLDQKVGQVFPKGEALLQLAADGDWILEIQVPEDLAGTVKVDQQGAFSAASFPTKRQRFQISTINGSAQPIDERNVFVARAMLQSRPDWMLNGMEGTARIETVRKPVWWVSLHRAVDWLRLNYWI